MQLADKTCVPCQGGIPPLQGDALDELKAEVLGWNVIEGHHLHRVYKFADFKSALDFVNVIGQIADEQGHHPDILLSWGKVEVTIYTHAVNGLTESDFVLAAKIDRAGH